MNVLQIFSILQCPVGIEYLEMREMPLGTTCTKEERTRAVMTPASGGGKPCEGATWTFLDPAIFGTLL